tara:strand:+ start:495 stop:1172 length:678 start_codon:yes stop_codon:yes gene_type:complete
MLSLKLGLSLVNRRLQGSWQPSDEARLDAWYKRATGITLNGDDVSKWNDQSGRNIHMEQGTASEQPLYNSGDIDFDSAATQNLQTTGQISLGGDFTIGVKLHLKTAGGVLLADNTTAGEFIRFTGTQELRVRIDNATAVNIAKDSGTFVEDAYMVLQRASNVLTLYWNGTAQADTETLSGTADIDAIGVRSTDLNPYDGEISEIAIFSSQSATLTSNLNNYLSKI